MKRTEPDPDDARLLLEFLRGRDAPCPACGYNLRDLPAPVCPECRKNLTLSVGFREPPFGWFLVTVTPGLFSGIAAAFLMVPLMIAVVVGHQVAPAPIWATDAFGWLSGGAALLLIRHRGAFLRQPVRRQRAWAVAAWLIHVAAFTLLVIAAILSS